MSESKLQALESYVDDLNAEMVRCRNSYLRFMEKYAYLKRTITENEHHKRYLSDKINDVLRLEKTINQIFTSQKIAHEQICNALDSTQNQSTNTSDFFETINKKIELVRLEYSKGMSILYKGFDDAQLEMRQLKEELVEKNIEIATYKSKLKECEELNRKNSSKLNASFVKEMDLKKSNLELNNNLNELNKDLFDKNKEVEELIESKRKISAEYSCLLEEYNRKQNDYEKMQNDARECVNVAKETLYEKRALIYKEQKALQSYEELKCSIYVQVEKEKIKYEGKLIELSEKHLVEIEDLKEKNNDLHQELIEMRCFLEKSEREKKSADSLYEKLKKNVDQCVSLTEYDTIYQKLRLAENARNEALSKVEKIEKEMRNLEYETSRQVQNARLSEERSKNHLKRLQASYEEVIAQNESENTFLTQISGENNLLRSKLDCMKTQRDRLKYTMECKATELAKYKEHIANMFYMESSELEAFREMHSKFNTKCISAMRRISGILKSVLYEEMDSITQSSRSAFSESDVTSKSFK